MDKLFYLDLLDEVENAEIEEENRENVHIDIVISDPFAEINDRSFKNIFKLTKELCNYLINLVRPYIRPQVKATNLDVPVKLHFVFLPVAATRKISVSRCVHEVVNALNQPAIFNNYVKFPGNFEQMNVVRRSFFDKYNFPGIIGCVECTHVAIFPPRIVDPNYPEHLYVNRKGYHSINVQLVSDSNLRILNVNARYPGSTNGAFIWSNYNLNATLQQLHANGHTDYFLLGDSGYPLRTWILTPLEEDPAEGTPGYRYNMAHKRIRSTIERCNGVLKTRFRCLLKHRVLHYSPQTACQIIN
ncbi:hypothetical protein MML48_9g00005574 [Holotrichia oblita]|uniref:Uncharacterized protein n=1 Tax=Holotrichia oblita TaxID=644536 RepID=A0ACB9SM56_HOLOL|nr:hypothetical protein MML48_9g00005574 [Holotrichia oblita]